MRTELEAMTAYIEAHPGIMPVALAEHLGVSVRTVRTYVKQANDAMHGVGRIQLSRKNGFRLQVSDQAAYEAWHSKEKSETPPQTPKDRVTYLLNDLLMRSDWVKLNDLSNALFVSRATITNDLKRAQKILDDYDLSIESRPHYGIRIVGPELSRRVCLANVIVNRYNNAMGDVESETTRTLSWLSSDLGSEDATSDPTLRVISSCVERVLQAEKFQINTASYRNLIVHIAVALVRIEENCYVPMAPEQIDQLKGRREFKVAQAIAAEIESALGSSCTLPEEEVAYIAIHLAGKRMMLDNSPKEEGLVVTDSVWHIVEEMVECVWKAFRFDFRNDLELHMNLARHIVPLAVRLRYHMQLKNPLLNDIKQRYALAYSMAMDASTVLARTYQAELSEDETAYIALAFALALERQKSEIPKKNILVVCASGAGSARLLEYRCRREFADYVDQIYTCDIMALDGFDFSKVDYVFTTVPIARKLPVPVREVSYFLGDEEVLNVREILDSQGKSDVIPPFFDRNLFFPHLSFTSKQKALDYLLDQACEHRSVSSNFRELVWKREAMVATSFGNRVAIPHPIEVASDETFICMGLLDNPVAWDTDGAPVQAIFLLGFAEQPHAGELSLHEFMNAFAGVLMDTEAIELLLKHQSWDTLIELIGNALKGADAKPN